MNEDTLLVDIRNLTIRTGNTLILNNAAFSIHQQEHWAIIGKSGSGKTSFAHALCGRQFYNGEINFYYSSAVHKGGVVLIEQQHRFKNLSNTSEFYYQQRFNSSDAENSITVMQALHNYNTSDTTDESLQKWISLLRLTPLLDEPLIQLSNGENKRLQLAEALLSDPAILILDNPFIGLDTEGRQTLYTIIDEITRNNIHIILITTPHELPVCITHIGVLENNSISFFPKEQYYAQAQVKNTAISPPILDREHLREIAKPENAGFSFAVQMRNVSIQYGNKKILNSINWEVRKGDC
jgi:molybdate transport system ATP-binding protein